MNSSKHPVGFMQGRLSPVNRGLLQEFPIGSWQDEFILGQRLGFRLIEWTIDQHTLSLNPLMTEPGRALIKKFKADYSFDIPSVTGDCFMQSPFWIHEKGQVRDSLEAQFIQVASSASLVGVRYIVVPLVDNGSIRSKNQERMLISSFEKMSHKLEELCIKVVFESDLGPAELSSFIKKLSPSTFGINYDIGNSASLGFCAEEELSAYGDRVWNVHIKDRLLGGTSVPLGSGAANFEKVFEALSKLGYSGNYILQTARDPKGDHSKALSRYLNFVRRYLSSD